MSSSDATNPSQAASQSHQADNSRHLSPKVRAEFERFQASGDPAALDPVLFAILSDFIPKPPARPLAELPGDTRLIDDLGYDSLAITEVVFFTEDLFRISISNEEIVQVRTLDDLRGFIHRKVAGREVR
jgi:acyl carrier protein